MAFGSNGMVETPTSASNGSCIVDVYKRQLLQCVKFQREKVNEKIIASISAEKLDEAEA